MAQIESCSFRSGPLRDFAPILKCWCKDVVEWCARIEWEDVPWWYS
jgi:hypothetical protein